MPLLNLKNRVMAKEKDPKKTEKNNALGAASETDTKTDPKPSEPKFDPEYAEWRKKQLRWD